MKEVVLVLGVPDTPGWKAISVLIVSFSSVYTVCCQVSGCSNDRSSQFGIAMFGSITFAIVSLSKIGMLTQLKEQLVIHYSTESLLNIFQISQ